MNSSERKTIVKNFSGYDISPDMTKMSLVNMYLHKFTNPKIYEYDTLTSEEKWNEYFDTILTNPPFMTPTGGIIPHKRFGINSTRAEVLFICYVIEHLTPKGKAGIVVPEGILERVGKQYELLGKKLIENGLVAIISLPAGVFLPYAEVKTSILIFDKNLAKNKKDLLFITVNNDGYTLTTSRLETSENDLPEIKKIFKLFYENKSLKKFKDSNTKPNAVDKSKIIENNHLLIPKLYRTKKTYDSKYKFVKLLELIQECKERHISGKENILSVSNKEGFTKPSGIFGHRVASKDIKNYKVIKNGYFAYNPSRINVGSIAFMQKNEVGQVSPMYIVFKIINTKVLDENFLLFILKSKICIEQIKLSSRGSVRQSLKFKSLCNISIPLPSLQEQKKIIIELDEEKQIIKNNQKSIEKHLTIIDETISNIWGQK